MQTFPLLWKWKTLSYPDKHWLSKRRKADLTFIFNKINTPVIFHLVMTEKSSRFTQNTKLVWVVQSHHSEYDHNNINTKGEGSYPSYLLLMQQSMIEATNGRISNDQVTLSDVVFSTHLLNSLLSCKQWFFCYETSQSLVIQLLGLRRDSVICFQTVARNQPHVRNVSLLQLERSYQTHLFLTI